MPHIKDEMVINKCFDGGQGCTTTCTNNSEFSEQILIRIKTGDFEADYPYDLELMTPTCVVKIKASDIIAN